MLRHNLTFDTTLTLAVASGVAVKSFPMTCKFAVSIVTPCIRIMRVWVPPNALYPKLYSPSFNAAYPTACLAHWVDRLSS